MNAHLSCPTQKITCWIGVLCNYFVFFFNQIYLVYKLHKIPSKQGILLKQAGHKNFTVLLKMN